MMGTSLNLTWIYVLGATATTDNTTPQQQLLSSSCIKTMQLCCALYAEHLYDFEFMITFLDSFRVQNSEIQRGHVSYNLL